MNDDHNRAHAGALEKSVLEFVALDSKHSSEYVVRRKSALDLLDKIGDARCEAGTCGHPEGFHE